MQPMFKLINFTYDVGILEEILSIINEILEI